MEWIIVAPVRRAGAGYDFWEGEGEAMDWELAEGWVEMRRAEWREVRAGGGRKDQARDER